MLELNKIYNMDCLEGIKLLDDNSIDSIVTDPPYGIEFMGKEWDSFSNNTNSALGKQSPANQKENTPFKKRGKPIDGWCEKDRLFARNNYYNFTYEWAKECFRVLKPGGFILVFGSPRMYHRMTCAIEDAGFSIRDCIMWIYGSGFPKSMDISKAIDKKFGAERKVVGTYKTPDGRDYTLEKSCQDGYKKTELSMGKDKGVERRLITAPATLEAKQYSGWGTALKPAHEPIVVARKPLSEKTVADNVLKWGTGGINIDDCRIELNGDYKCKANGRPSLTGLEDNYNPEKANQPDVQGRFPANIILDEEAGKLLDEQSGISTNTRHMSYKRSGGEFIDGIPSQPEKDWFKQETGGASRFFYCAKASKKERGEGNNHPTVKPLSLIKYLVTLVTPPNGISCDPFEGSGTHAKACKELGFDYIGFEKEKEYCEISENRLKA